MSDYTTNSPLETDWERVDKMTDEEIDTSDIPPLSEDFFRRARVRLPRRKVKITVTVDEDVLAWFKDSGRDYKQRINAALRIYADAHRIE